MKYILDENGFLLYATSFDTVENFTTIEYLGGFKKPQLANEVWLEGATQQELETINTEAIAKLRAEYSKKIDELVNESVQRKVRTGEEIPVEIEDMVKALKQEYKDKVAEL